MATGPSELLEQSEECTDFVKELLTQKEDIQNHLKEGSKEDAKIPASQGEVNGKTNEIEEEEKSKLHILEKDLDEFVDSMTEATPSVLPKKSLEAEKHLLPEMAPAKLPRAEQVAEKVLRAEKVVERAQRVEKPPALEKVAEKVPRVEKAPQVEKAVRAEKTAEKPHLAAPRTVSVRRKAESRAAKDTLPWEGLTLNKCILVASFLALLSVSCQVVQEVIEYGGTVLEAELSAWTTQEDSAGEQEELWFYERWFDWSDMDEPPEVEEEELLEVEEELLEVEEELLEVEEEEEAPSEEDGGEKTEPVETEEKEAEVADEEAEIEEEPVTKVSPRKSQEKVRRETPSKNKGRKGRKAEEEEEEEEKKKHLQDRRHRREGKGKEKQQEDRKTHRHKHDEAAHPSKAHKQEHHSPDEKKGHSKGERGKGRGHLKHERDQKDRKPWQTQKPFFSPPKDSAQTFGRHKFQEWKRHD